MSASNLAVWLVPALPLAACLLLTLGFGRSGRRAAGLAIAAIAGATLCAGLGLFAAAHGSRPRLALPWLTVGGRQLELALALDPLGALMATLVSVVSLLVFVYAASYMARDPREHRFFTIFSLFAGAMLTLVLAADLLTLFLAWELVGLCSYLLIGFWFERPNVPEAATKAFLTTRLADQAMLAGVLLLVSTTGTSRIDTILGAASTGKLATGLLLVSALLLFTGAAGKSAQLPFQGWLPDAMAGPTPVSALLHSATMVASGVFLVARLYPLFLAARWALPVIAWIGALTALLGAGAALVQTDLKRTLAYSTMSQLGLMFVGLGSGNLLAGVLLLVAQALYKAPLFLAAGAIDHAVAGTSFARMGGLARRMPYTFAVFVVGAAALAGLPVTLALPPKDPVLAAALGAQPLLFGVALVASLGTALYSARLLGLVFLGLPSEPARTAREAPRGLLVPMLALLVLIVVGLLANADITAHPLARLLGTRAADSGSATLLALATAALGVLLGLAARRRWPHAVLWPPLVAFAPALATELGLRRLYATLGHAGLRLADGAATIDRTVFDPIAATIASGVQTTTGRAAAFDRAVFDSWAAQLATWTLALTRAGARFDRRQLDAAFNGFGRSILGASQRLRRLQTGRIENYLLAAFIWGLGLLVLAGLAITLR